MSRPSDTEFIPLELRAQTLYELVILGVVKLEDVHPLSVAASGSIRAMLLQALKSKQPRAALAQSDGGSK